jgi:hypothetical protein
METINKGALLLIAIAVSIVAAAPYPVESPAGSLPLPLQQLLRVKYEPVSTVDGLPSSIQAALFGRMKHDPRLANPGTLFNATDVVNSKLPMRRLIVAGGSPNSWFICYEHGGRGYHRQLVIFATDTDTPKIIFAGRFTAEVKSYKELREVVQRNLIPDETADAERYSYY